MYFYIFCLVVCDLYCDQIRGRLSDVGTDTGCAGCRWVETSVSCEEHTHLLLRTRIIPLECDESWFRQEPACDHGLDHASSCQNNKQPRIAVYCRK